MALEISNPYRLMSKSKECKSFSKPEDVLRDHYLTNYQKNIILEAMLSEVSDFQDQAQSGMWGLFSQSPAKKVADILKAQAVLKSRMIQEPLTH